MEEKKKKKSKIGKYILLMILLCVLIFLVIIIRKIVIIRGLQNKIEKYKSATNYYYKVINEGEDSGLEYYELYMKDGVIKTVMKHESEGSITQFEYPNEIKTFMDLSENNKILSVYENDYPAKVEPFATNYLYEKNDIWGSCLYSILSTIDTKKVDGKEYYVISGMKNSNYLYDENAVKMEIYVDKETGFAETVVNYFEDNSTQKIHYEIKFDIVTDDDLQEPDESQYTLREY